VFVEEIIIGYQFHLREHILTKYHHHSPLCTTRPTVEKSRVHQVYAKLLTTIKMAFEQAAPRRKSRQTTKAVLTYLETEKGPEKEKEKNEKSTPFLG
jgi:hypothetical protein